MPSFCAVLDCIDKYGHARTVPFHKFPAKNKEQMEKWINFTQRPSDWQPSRWMSICGLHFREEDYRCLEQKKLLKKTAIPSVRTITRGEKDSNENQETQIASEVTTCAVSSSNIKNNNKQTLNCRLCDTATTNFKSFAGNFEIFGVIQKCLPTLSICQDDNLPKEICSKCLKHLESFAHFIDKVLETQATLQQRFRHEKSSNVKPTERTLKIKQEPVVRVKQENLDDINVFFPDEVDDGNDADNDASNTDAQLEQKYQFCDFPVLNDQDLINNCDIMEIINLSDPFIDITNCENTIAEEEQQQQQNVLARSNIDNTKTLVTAPPTQTRQLQTAHELLQSHLLIEEHNYAYAAEDFKEEWQIKNCYKTEKIEVDESIQEEQNVTMNCFLNDYDSNLNGIIDDGTTIDIAALATVETTLLPTTNEIERSIKPIVTSISSFNEAYPPPPQQTTFQTTCDQQQQHIQETTSQPLQSSHQTEVIPQLKDYQTTVQWSKPLHQSPQTPSRKRPNIVVLNESIVQSSHLLQACTICQSKFIGIDSLNQHYKTAHNTLPLNSTSIITTSNTPMVTVPTANLTTTETATATTWNNYLPQNQNQAPIQIQSCKIEKDIGMESNQFGVQVTDFNTNLHQSDGVSNVQFTTKRSSKNEIKILDMQQSFGQHQYSNYSNLIHFDQSTFSSLNTAQINSISAFPLETRQQATTAAPTISYTTSTPTSTINLSSTTNSLSLTTNFLSPTNISKKPDIVTESSNDIAAKYLALQKSYQRLRIKCQQLTNKTNSKKNSKRIRFRCRFCNLRFNTIFQLLHHRQTTPQHQPRKHQTYFFATCPGCEKFFCNKIGLFNHMRYVCQSLPLSWFKSQIRSFKCRCCRLITFTHWRLYRRHEVKCRQRHKLKQVESKKFTSNQSETKRIPDFENTSNKVNNSKTNSKRQTKKKQTAPYTCTICNKVYPSSSSLSQHQITHSNLRSFSCEICKRIFKRRNGLTQHVRGFHLKLRPFQCPTCKHSYALKADMKRCKHSIINRNKKSSKRGS